MGDEGQTSLVVDGVVVTNSCWEKKKKAEAKA
jgi:hypothetical protein